MTGSGPPVLDDLEIRPPHAIELDAVCEVIGLAFADNPSTLANVRGDRVKAMRAMRGAARLAKFGRRSSTALIALRDGEVVAALNAAAWPRCRLRWTEKLTMAPGMLRALGRALPRTMAMAARRERHDPARPHWHIGPIGVRPDLQGKGIGQALLGSFLSTLDADPEAPPAFLETDVAGNERLYARWGFETIGRAPINGVDTAFMFRQTGLSG